MVMLVVVGVAAAVVAYVVTAAATRWIRRPNRAPLTRGVGWVLVLSALGALVWRVSDNDNTTFLIAFLVAGVLLPLLHHGLPDRRNRHAHTS